MNIYTAHWKHDNDDYYASHNRKMFTTRELADAFLTDLLNYEHIGRYYVLEEEVYEEFIPLNDYDYDDYYENQYGRDYEEYDDADEFYSDPLEDYYSGWFKLQKLCPPMGSHLQKRENPFSLYQ
jgi:hypothetical protein